MDRRRTGPGHRVVPYPMLQHQMIDWLALMHRQHTVHALLELDVTQARRAIRAHRARTGEALSFTAFIVDGAPAARFEARLRDLVESGAGLGDPDAGGTPGGTATPVGT